MQKSDLYLRAKKVNWEIVSYALVIILILHFGPFKGIIIPEFVGLHTILEISCILVALMIFVVQYLSRSFSSSEKYQIFGIPFLGIALLDILHTLSYRGLADLVTVNTPQKSISFWLAARFFEAIAFLYFAFILRTKSLRSKITTTQMYSLTFAIIAAVTYAVFVSPDVIPIFATPEGKITPLKIALEYVLIFGHLVICWLLLNVPEPFNKNLNELITASLLLALGGLTFSSFSDGHDIMIFTGHIIKTIAYIFIFKSFLVNELVGPYLTIVKLTDNLQQQNQSLRVLQLKLLEAERLSAINKEGISAVVNDTNNILSATEQATQRMLDLLSSLRETKSIDRIHLEKMNQNDSDQNSKVDPEEE